MKSYEVPGARKRPRFATLLRDYYVHSEDNDGRGYSGCCSFKYCRPIPLFTVNGVSPYGSDAFWFSFPVRTRYAIVSSSPKSDASRAHGNCFQLFCRSSTNVPSSVQQCLTKHILLARPIFRSQTDKHAGAHITLIDSLWLLSIAG